MKTFFSILSISSLLYSALALPASSIADESIAKRACPAAVNAATYASALTLVEGLKTAVDGYTADIASTHSTFVSNKDTTTATTAYKASVSSLNAAFQSYTSQIVALTGVPTDKVLSKYSACLFTKRDLEVRQTSITTEIEEIIEELTTAIDAIVADLGLTATLSFLDPLLASLGGLLLSLVPVVNNLLLVVGELLDGLLIGLGLGLAGIGL